MKSVIKLKKQFFLIGACLGLSMGTFAVDNVTDIVLGDVIPLSGTSAVVNGPAGSGVSFKLTWVGMNNTPDKSKGNFTCDAGTGIGTINSVYSLGNYTNNPNPIDEDNAKFPSTAYNYIQIENTSDLSNGNEITQFSILGVALDPSNTTSSGNMYLPFAFADNSGDFNAYNDSKYSPFGGSGPNDNTWQILFQLKNPTKCDGNIIGTGATGYNSALDPASPYYKSPKIIKLGNCSQLGWGTYDTNSQKIIPYVARIKIWTKPATPNTGISSANMDGFTCSFADGQLNFTELASSISVFDISGKTINSVQNVQDLSLAALPSGVYVVKAASATGKSLVTKVAK